jgi:hypothetical protein
MELSGNSFSSQKAFRELGDNSLSDSYAAFISSASGVPPISGVLSDMTPKVNMTANILEHSDSLISWPNQIGMDGALYLDLFLGTTLDDGELYDWSEPRDLETDLTTGSLVAHTYTEAILQQAALSPWHEQIIAIAEKFEQIGLIIRSYEKAVQLTDGRPEWLVSNLGYRFWLAKIWAYKLGCEETALKLWNSIEKFCERVYKTPSNDNGNLRLLHTLTLDELSCREKITNARAAIRQIVANTSPSHFPSISLFHVTRKLIFLGKGMEYQKEPEFLVREVYLRGVRSCLAFTDDKSPRAFLTCLGNALLALGEYNDARHALRLGDRVRWSLGGAIEAIYVIDTFCDKCRANVRSSTEYIQAFRFKCITCADMDLCENCFAAREQGIISADIRHCNAEQAFMKIPCPNEDSEESAIGWGATADNNLRLWLDGLRAKFQDDYFSDTLI